MLLFITVYYLLFIICLLFSSVFPLVLSDYITPFVIIFISVLFLELVLSMLSFQCHRSYIHNRNILIALIILLPNIS